MVKFVNCTPHDIRVGDIVYPKSGSIARVSEEYTHVKDNFWSIKPGEVSGLPEPRAGIYFIVSAMVMNATERQDVIAPATGHPNVVRDEMGRIISVPGFIIKKR